MWLLREVVGGAARVSSLEEAPGVGPNTILEIPDRVSNKNNLAFFFLLIILGILKRSEKMTGEIAPFIGAEKKP